MEYYKDEVMEVLQKVKQWVKVHYLMYHYLECTGEPVYTNILFNVIYCIMYSMLYH